MFSVIKNFGETEREGNDCSIRENFVLIKLFEEYKVLKLLKISGYEPEIQFLSINSDIIPNYIIEEINNLIA